MQHAGDGAQSLAALRGIRVLDFGQFIAGPLCAALLGDFGADVIRIERPGGGADRYVQPVGDAAAGGAVYLQVNRNKRSLALDPFDDRSREVLDRLIGSADVVIANVPAPTLESMGLSYARISRLNPRIILSTCTAFGSKGPLADLPGFDGVGQAMSGAMHLSGEQGEPRKAYVHWVDHLTAVLSAFGVLAALRARDLTGGGQQVQTSLARSALFAMAANLIEEDVLHLGRSGTGNRAQLAGPADVYPTADGHVLLQVIGAGMFRRCAKLVDRSDWLQDARFATDELRGENGADLGAVMAGFCRSRTTEECLSAFRSAGLPCAPILDLAGALAQPSFQAEAMWTWAETPDGETRVPLASPPVVMSETPGVISSVSPKLGQHTQDILDELGMSAAAREALITAGVAAIYR
jgi:crotonobetainyl-CoA:carnitine CoA-transferase CaiB-like acyl-CoA transferase